MNPPAIWPKMVAFFMLLFLPACQGQPVAAVTNGNVQITAVPFTNTPLILSATSQPPIIESPMPSFALPTPAPFTPTLPPSPIPATLTFTPSPEQLQVAPLPALTATPPITSSATHSATSSSPTPSPQPTFTPPPLPATTVEEHYWFQRPVAEGGVVWTNKHYPYGSTRNGELRPHHGVEFDVPHNTEILAVASGTVLVAGPDNEIIYGEHLNFYGKLVVIQHDTTYQGQPVFTLYGHLSQPLVTVGQQVEAEQVIALSGASGVADGPHMHFEVRVGQNSYDATRNPLLWLWPFPDRGTVAGRVVFPDGTLAHEAAVRVERIDAGSRYAATTTYAQDGLNADDMWQENFVIDDVTAGYYQVIVTAGEEKFIQELWVYPQHTSFIEIVIMP